MSDEETYRGALAAVERIVDRGGDPDDVLRDVVAALHEDARLSWAGIAFVEGDGLQLGPAAGTRAGDPESTPIGYEGRKVAELLTEPSLRSEQDGQAFLGRVAALVSTHCLVGWDTGGEAWEP